MGAAALFEMNPAELSWFANAIQCVFWALCFGSIVLGTRQPAAYHQSSSIRGPEQTKQLKTIIAFEM